MYQDGHRRAKNQSNWSKSSTVQVQKVRGPNILCAPLTFRWGARAPRPPVPTPLANMTKPNPENCTNCSSMCGDKGLIIKRHINSPVYSITARTHIPRLSSTQAGARHIGQVRDDRLRPVKHGVLTDTGSNFVSSTMTDRR